jgi:hypothetical protein
MSMLRQHLRVAARAALLSTVIAGIAAAQTPAPAPAPITGQQMSGPVIQSTGMSIKVDDPTFLVPDGQVLKAVFEINAGGGDTVRVNEQLNNVARFYNVNVRHGLPELSLIHI